MTTKKNKKISESQLRKNKLRYFAIKKILADVQYASKEEKEAAIKAFYESNMSTEEINIINNPGYYDSKHPKLGLERMGVY